MLCELSSHDVVWKDCSHVPTQYTLLQSVECSLIMMRYEWKVNRHPVLFELSCNDWTHTYLNLVVMLCELSRHVAMNEVLLKLAMWYVLVIVHVHEIATYYMKSIVDEEVMLLLWVGFMYAIFLVNTYYYVRFHFQNFSI